MDSNIISKTSLKRPNFNPDEFFVSEKAKILGVENYPPQNEEIAILTALMSTADLMQEIRGLFGKPITINSAYRSKIVNDAVGSKDSSQHRQGLACDFTCSQFGTPEDIVRFLFDKKIIVDQCFNEGSWVHISRCLPNQVMTKNPNRMMFGFYLKDGDGKRSFKPLV